MAQCVVDSATTRSASCNHYSVRVKHRSTNSIVVAAKCGDETCCNPHERKIVLAALKPNGHFQRARFSCDCLGFATNTSYDGPDRTAHTTLHAASSQCNATVIALQATIASPPAKLHRHTEVLPTRDVWFQTVVICHAIGCTGRIRYPTPRVLSCGAPYGRRFSICAAYRH